MRAVGRRSIVSAPSVSMLITRPMAVACIPSQCVLSQLRLSLRHCVSSFTLRLGVHFSSELSCDVCRSTASPPLGRSLPRWMGRWVVLYSGRNETLNFFPPRMPSAALANSHIYQTQASVRPRIFLLFQLPRPTVIFMPL